MFILFLFIFWSVVMIVDYSFIALLFVFCLVLAEFVADVEGKLRMSQSSDEVTNMVYFSYCSLVYFMS